MINKKLLIWGLGGMLVVFALLNAWPYVLLSKTRDAIELEVVEVTGEDGSRVDFVSKSSSVSREMARNIADMLKVRNDTVEEEEEIFFVEVILHNKTGKEIRLLEANYRIRIDGIATAKGSYRRSKPLSISAHGRERVLLPIELMLPPSRFSTLVEKNIRATVVGEVWVPRGKHKIRLDFERDISLAQFDL